MNSINEDLHLIKEKRHVTFDPQFYFIFVFLIATAQCNTFPDFQCPDSNQPKGESEVK